MLQDVLSWFDLYQLGFGHFRLVTPGFTAHHYIYMVQFLQEVDLLWSHALEDSLCGGSLLEEDVNPAHTWLDWDLAEEVTLWQCKLLGEALDVDVFALLGGQWVSLKVCAWPNTDSKESA